MLAGDQVGFPSSEALKSTTTRYQVHCCFCPCKDQRRVRQQLPLSLCLMRKKKTLFPPLRSSAQSGGAKSHTYSNTHSYSTSIRFDLARRDKFSESYYSYSAEGGTICMYPSNRSDMFVRRRCFFAEDPRPTTACRARLLAADALFSFVRGSGQFRSRPPALSTSFSHRTAA